MIVIDSSAIIAIAANEPMARDREKVLATEKVVLISAGTFAEVLIVSARRKLVQDVSDLLNSVITKTIDVTPFRAQRAAAAYSRWGKGFHPASLNFGDCFAYATAQEFDCPLLFIGDDFARTDIKPAIAA
ncbi:type II toxin-antitoxin system VapC family toxin [Neorhizobium sp. JUb45]|uniref:type II toxin-antitoxin system VapC family toxin n=1 Tax=unclassified Neorhizobium TaxID=2629175 RepID=UPI0010460235|nr:type II toxin-antitoxin system VapC family toxin [Neorhizobium sp. JUb45]TCR06357.1 ribonuclease VapC [Neorhizobium sp. JUb45]